MEAEADNTPALAIAAAFRKLNRPYLALIGLVINLVCVYKHLLLWNPTILQNKHYYLNIALKLIFFCNFFFITLDQFAVQVFLEKHFSQELCCRIRLTINDLTFCSNLTMVILFFLVALNLQVAFVTFLIFSIFSCLSTVHTIVKVQPEISKQNEVLICGFKTDPHSSAHQRSYEVIIFIFMFPIIYQLQATLSKRFPIKSLAFWFRMLPLLALLLASEFLLIFNWLDVEVSTHQFLLISEITECVSKFLGWIVLPIFMIFVQLGLLRSKSIIVPQEVVLELEDLEPFTFQRRLSTSTLHSEL